MMQTNIKFLSLLFLLLIQGRVFAMSEMPESSLKYPIHAQFINGGSASGFFLRSGEKIFFVTAKHVLSGVENNKKLILTAYTVSPGFDDKVKLQLDLAKLNQKGFVKQHMEKDVAVIEIAKTVKIDNKDFLNFVVGVDVIEKSHNGSEIVSLDVEKSIKKYSDVLISNDVFIFGYPTSIGIPNLPQIDREKPLLRKGIIAAKNEKLQTIVLDCPVDFGNSGGPVLQIEQISLGVMELRIIGVVTEKIPFVEPLANKRFGVITESYQNSGYSIVVPMDAVLELINDRIFL